VPRLTDGSAGRRAAAGRDSAQPSGRRAGLGSPTPRPAPPHRRRRTGADADGPAIAPRFTSAGPFGPDRRWTVRKAEFLPQLTDINDGFRAVNLNAALALEPGRSDYLRARDAIRKVVPSRGAARSGLIMTK